TIISSYPSYSWATALWGGAIERNAKKAVKIQISVSFRLKLFKSAEHSIYRFWLAMVCRIFCPWGVIRFCWLRQDNKQS
ncbi:hypothetical protein BCR33DRAFT_720299, partial [Rhizoclosmatium globosum]